MIDADVEQVDMILGLSGRETQLHMEGVKESVRRQSKTLSQLLMRRILSCQGSLRGMKEIRGDGQACPGHP